HLGQRENGGHGGGNRERHRVADKSRAPGAHAGREARRSSAATRPPSRRRRSMRYGSGAPPSDSLYSINDRFPRLAPRFYSRKPAAHASRMQTEYNSVPACVSPARADVIPYHAMTASL